MWLVCLLFTAFAAAALPSSVIVWHWPLSTPSPAPLATIAYDPTTLNSSTNAYTPPSIPLSTDQKDLVRVGFYDPKVGPSSWSGTVTSAASFDPKAQHQISLTLSRSGVPISVSFHAFKEDIDPREERRRAKREERQKKREEEMAAKGKVPRSKAGKSKKGEQKREQPTIEIVKTQEGVRPTLNKPVVLNEQGKVEGTQEKSFLQKYWWAIGIFLLVQLISAGGGGEEKK